MRVRRFPTFAWIVLACSAAWAQNSPFHLTILDFDYAAHRAGLQTVSHRPLLAFDVSLGPRSQVLLLSKPGDATAHGLAATLRKGLKRATESDLEPAPELSYHYDPDPGIENAPRLMISVLQVKRSSRQAFEDAQEAVSKSAAQAKMVFSWYAFRQAGGGEPLVYYFFTPIDSYAAIDRLGSAFVARAANANSPGYNEMIQARAVLDRVTQSATQFVVLRANATAPARP